MTKTTYDVNFIDGSDEYPYSQCIARVKTKTSYKALCKALKVENLESNTKFFLDNKEYSVDYVEVGPNYTKALQANIKNIDDDLVLVTDCFSLIETRIVDFYQA